MAEDIFDGLHGLGIRASREALSALIKELTKARASPLVVCERLVALEKQERDRRNLDRRQREAQVGPFRSMADFDWSWPRSIDRSLIEMLMELAFVDEGHNVLLRGQSGTGKTMIAQNLATLAVQRGHRVRFATLAAVLADLMRQESSPALERRMRRYTTPDLLVLDEVGYLPHESRAADLLYNIIARRHERRSTIITTNLPFKQWPSIFPSAACVSALVDRFAQHCHRVDIDADSHRQREASQPTGGKPRRR